mmetsp:Transcript_10183/g.41448  ORF Transcript_10183/g.41448 Transcript_10183/m.41448 type:complete len:227 (+) Transcript_10183:884-1564(+)
MRRTAWCCRRRTWAARRRSCSFGGRRQATAATARRCSRRRPPCALRKSGSALWRQCSAGARPRQSLWRRQTARQSASTSQPSWGRRAPASTSPRRRAASRRLRWTRPLRRRAWPRPRRSPPPSLRCSRAARVAMARQSSSAAFDASAAMRQRPTSLLPSARGRPPPLRPSPTPPWRLPSSRPLRRLQSSASTGPRSPRSSPTASSPTGPFPSCSTPPSTPLLCTWW